MQEDWRKKYPIHVASNCCGGEEYEDFWVETIIKLYTNEARDEFVLTTSGDYYIGSERHEIETEPFIIDESVVPTFFEGEDLNPETFEILEARRAQKYGPQQG